VTALSRVPGGRNNASIVRVLLQPERGDTIIDAGPA
jgi:hypothetical protein